MLIRSLIFSIIASFTASAVDDSILMGSIPGEAQVRLASARPAPKSMQLLFACGIDQYLQQHKEDFDKLKFAYRECKDTRDTAIYIFRNYKIQYPRFSPDGEPQTYSNQRKSLETFLSSGYNGQYVNELTEYIKELKSLESKE